MWSEFLMTAGLANFKLLKHFQVLQVISFEQEPKHILYQRIKM